jgi:cytochrome c553
VDTIDYLEKQLKELKNQNRASSLVVKTTKVTEEVSATLSDED